MLNNHPVNSELTPRPLATPIATNGHAGGNSNGASPATYVPRSVPGASNGFGPGPGRSSDAIDVGMMLTTLWRRRRLMLTTFALVVAAGALLTLRQRSVYEATCRILITTPNESNPAASDTLRALLSSTQPRSIGTQLAIMRSYPVQRATLKRLPPAQQQIAKEFNDLEVRPQRDSDAIDIVAQSYDPVVAANLANSLSEEYMAQYQNQNRLQVTAGTKQVSEQLVGARNRLDDASNALKNYKLGQGTINLSEESSARLAQVNQIETTLRDLQADRASTVAQLKSLNSQIGAQPEAQTVPNDIVRSPQLETLRGQLNQLDLQRIATARRYREGSPELKNIDLQRADIQKQMASVKRTEISSWRHGINPIRQGLSQESARAQTQIKAIDARMADLRGAENRARAQEALLPEREYRLSQLINDQTTLRQTYQLLNEKYQGLLVSEGAKLTTARPLEPAEAPDHPIKPRRALNIALSLILGGFSAIALALLAEKMDDRVRSAHGAETAAQLPVLAQIPALSFTNGVALHAAGTNGIGSSSNGVHTHGASGNGVDASGALTNGGAIGINGSNANGSGASASSRVSPPYADSFSPLLENFRLLRTNLMQPGANGTLTLPRSILVTSSRQGEGKSGCALNLAIATALGGRKVVLIDADLRHPTLHTTLGLSASRGLSEVVRGEISLDEALQTTDVPGLQFLAGGTPVTGAAELLDSDAARQILQNAIARADCAIFNCSPVLGHADTSILASIAQCALLVVSEQESQGSDLAEAREALARTGIYLPGLVLNVAQSPV